MNLGDYFRQGDSLTQTALAKRLGVSQGLVSQWVAGRTAVSAERAIEIERATSGAVRCEELRPDVDWAAIRGTAPAPSERVA